MPCKHVWQQIARMESGDYGDVAQSSITSYEVERCVKCTQERCLRTERHKVKLEGCIEGCEPYLKAAYFDIGYTLINYGAKDIKAAGISNPKALEEAMTAYMEAYNEEGKE